MVDRQAQRRRARHQGGAIFCALKKPSQHPNGPIGPLCNHCSRCTSWNSACSCLCLADGAHARALLAVKP
eukprot:206138-Pleurochrysis_carterae.AAC.1